MCVCVCVHMCVCVFVCVNMCVHVCVEIGVFSYLSEIGCYRYCVCYDRELEYACNIMCARVHVCVCEVKRETLTIPSKASMINWVDALLNDTIPILVHYTLDHMTIQFL